MNLKSDFLAYWVDDYTMLVVDLDLGNMSVTNNAEAVVASIWAEFRPSRIIYIDSMRNAAELMHSAGVFNGFKSIEVVKSCRQIESY